MRFTKYISKRFFLVVLTTETLLQNVTACTYIASLCNVQCFKLAALHIIDNISDCDSKIWQKMKNENLILGF